MGNLSLWPTNSLEEVDVRLWDILASSDDLSLAPGEISHLMQRLQLQSCWPNVAIEERSLSDGLQGKVEVACL